MKYLITSDLHIGNKKDNPSFHDTVLKFADTLDAERKRLGCKGLIICGDVFHDRKEISLPSLDCASEFFRKLNHFTTIEIIPGNHDCLYRDDARIHSLKSFHGNNIKVYDEVTYTERGDVKLAFVPWTTKPPELNNHDFMFGHFEFVGFQMAGGEKCKKGIKASDLLKKCNGGIFTGHFHGMQTKTYKNGFVHYMGSPYQLTWGEKNNRNHIAYLDTETKEWEKIEVSGMPKHIEMTPKDDKGLADGNYVKFYMEEDGDEPLLDTALDVSVETLFDKSQVVGEIQSFKSLDVFENLREYIKTAYDTNSQRERIEAEAFEILEKNL